MKGRALIDLAAYGLKCGDYGDLPAADAKALFKAGRFDIKAVSPEDLAAQEAQAQAEAQAKAAAEEKAQTLATSQAQAGLDSNDGKSPDSASSGNNASGSGNGEADSTASQPGTEGAGAA